MGYIRSGIIVENRQARFNYEISETFTAGLVLNGWEVKGCRHQQASIVGAHCSIDNQQITVSGMVIEPLSQSNGLVKYDTTRVRTLLMTKQEINRLNGAVIRKGYTIVVLDCRIVNSRIKLTIGLGKGKKLHDKREAVKKREAERDCSVVVY